MKPYCPNVLVWFFFFFFILAKKIHISILSYGFDFCGFSLIHLHVSIEIIKVLLKKKRSHQVKPTLQKQTHELLQAKALY